MAVTIKGTHCTKKKVTGNYCTTHLVKSVNPNPTNPHPPNLLRHYTGLDVDDCMKMALNAHKGPALGQGDQGVTYILTEHTVVKVSKITTSTPEFAWLAEAVIGLELGDAAIAPRIYDFFVCSNYGFIIMDRLEPIRSKTFTTNAKRDAHRGDEIRLKVKHRGGVDVVDHIARMSREHQDGFIKALRTMLELGYIHMDNHVDNLGFIEGRPVVFDFGFTQRRLFEKADVDIALAFSIFQILEHCPTDEIDDARLFHAACTCLTHEEPCSVSQLPQMLKGTLATATSWANEHLSDAVADLYVGCVAYARILNMERVRRYDTAEYDLIFKIRNPNNPG
jgi:hypothetical protein